ncbi:MAG: hypothetical protein WBG57_12045 [Ornithinimicrobium sp.]
MLVGRMEHLVHADAPSGVAAGLVTPANPIRMEQGTDLVLPTKPPAPPPASRAASFLQRLPALRSSTARVAQAISPVDPPSTVVDTPQTSAPTETTSARTEPASTPAEPASTPAALTHAEAIADVSHEIAEDLAPDLTVTTEPQQTSRRDAPTSTVQRTARAAETSPLPPMGPRRLGVALPVTPAIHPALPEAEPRPLPVVSRLTQPMADAAVEPSLGGQVDAVELPVREVAAAAAEHSEGAVHAEANGDLPTSSTMHAEVSAPTLATPTGDQRPGVTPVPTAPTAQRSTVKPAAEILPATPPSPGPAPYEAVAQQPVRSTPPLQRSAVARPLAPTTSVEGAPGNDQHLPAEPSVAPMPALGAPVTSRSVPGPLDDVPEPVSPIAQHQAKGQEGHHEASADTTSPDVVPVLAADLQVERLQAGATALGQPSSPALDAGTGRQMPLQRVTRSWNQPPSPAARDSATCTTSEPAVTASRAAEQPNAVQQAFAQAGSHDLTSSVHARPESSPVRVGPPLHTVPRHTPLQRTRSAPIPEHPRRTADSRTSGRPASAPNALPLAQMFSVSLTGDAGDGSPSLPEAQFTETGSPTVVQRQGALQGLAPLPTGENSGESSVDAAAEPAVAAGATPSSARPEPPGPASSPADIDELARRLFDPLSARLRSELWLDRERAGLSIELRR